MGFKVIEWGIKWDITVLSGNRGIKWDNGDTRRFGRISGIWKDILGHFRICWDLVYIRRFDGKRYICFIR